VSFTIHDSRFTIHDLLPFSTAHRRQDRNLAVIRDSGIKELFAPNVIIVKENIYVRSQLSLLIDYSVAQAQMLPPQNIQRFTKRRGGSFDDDLPLPIRKIG
jgi:hypothetical protein